MCEHLGRCSVPARITLACVLSHGYACSESMSASLRPKRGHRSARPPAPGSRDRRVTERPTSRSTSAGCLLRKLILASMFYVDLHLYHGRSLRVATKRKRRRRRRSLTTMMTMMTKTIAGSDEAFRSAVSFLQSPSHVETDM